MKILLLSATTARPSRYYNVVRSGWSAKFLMGWLLAGKGRSTLKLEVTDGVPGKIRDLPAGHLLGKSNYKYPHLFIPPRKDKKISSCVKIVICAQVQRHIDSNT